MDNIMRFGAVTVHLGEKSGKFPDGNQVLVQGADTRVAFDTPLVSNRIGPDFDSVDMVILGHVHEDHMAGLHRVPHARVLVHEADLAAAQSWEGLARHFGYSDAVLAQSRAKIEEKFFYCPRPDAIGYSDGATWDLGAGVTVRARHMPGHTAGHCVLVIENEGVACLGDIDLTGFGPYYGDASSSLTDFRQSLRKVAELDARVWVTYHHRGVLTERKAFLEALQRFTDKLDERTDKLTGYLREAPHSLDELVARRLLYPADYQAAFINDVERRSIQMHLDELLTESRAQRLEDGRYQAS